MAEPFTGMLRCIVMTAVGNVICEECALRFQPSLVLFACNTLLIGAPVDWRMILNQLRGS